MTTPLGFRARDEARTGTAARIGTALRAHAGRAALVGAVNFALPFVIYSLLHQAYGEAPALIAAGIPPLAFSLIEFLRARRIDATSLLVLTGLLLSLIAFAGGGGVKWLQLRENLVSAVVGLIFLGSVAIGRPLLWQLARARAQRGAPEKLAMLEALRTDAGFRRAMTLATLVWAGGLIAAAAVNCSLVFLLSIRTFLLVSGPIGYGAIAAMTAWTFWYVPRARRLAERTASTTTA
ncbi:MAG TPA: VC0807 family protein [Phenylobacterium sp.]|uniref:VC0807 family protein n=1 Tax=Phenylobacterium sp. TaxID=1871053 RepID=UPI002C8C1D95|nr:VC0807 family protein [Phenylobacterium sp.]HSV04226.1 VC0807 family protein [Phenylobacterium sp.]